MFNNAESPIVRHCIFKENHASVGGGGMYNTGFYCFPKVENCIFIGNTSAAWGGGIYNQENSTLILKNCTFSDNSAQGFGGGIYTNSVYNATNCIFWGNEALYVGNEMYNIGAYDSIFTCCDIKDSYVEDNYVKEHGTGSILGTNGGGNIDEDPQFVDPDDGDLHLGSNSPCIDAGDPNGSYIGQADIDCDVRLRDGDADCNSIVDIGADEVPNPCPCMGDNDCNDYLNTDDSDALAAYLQENGDPNDGYKSPIVPGFECSDLNSDDFLSTNDLNVLLMHLFTHGDPNDKYKAPCWTP